jgi:hypothetical protein
VPTKLIPWTDARGKRHWVEVEADVARDLDNFDRTMRRREAAYRSKLRTETDVRARREVRPRKERSAGKLRGFLNVELETAYRVMQRADAGNPWEGPRYTFSHLLGESPSWPPLDAGLGVDESGKVVVGSVAIDAETQRVVRWDGERWVCAFCAGQKLEAHQACLSCARTGRDPK